MAGGWRLHKKKDYPKNPDICKKCKYRMIGVSNITKNDNGGIGKKTETPETSRYFCNYLCMMNHSRPKDKTDSWNHCSAFEKDELI